MARGIAPTDEDVMQLARAITDEMLKRMKQPSRNGAQTLSDTGGWKLVCEDFDAGFSNMIKEWINANADRNEAARRADPDNYINIDGERIFIDKFFDGVSTKVET